MTDWPKKIPVLTKEQKLISDDWMKYWHEIMPKKYGIFAKFNHSYVVKNAPKNFLKTLEIGCGDGEHLSFEKLTPLQRKNYIGVDIRKNMIAAFKKNCPDVKALLADCQKKLPFDDSSFDRVLAIHVLEHLPNLPIAIEELHRVCKKNNSVLSVVLPCEGGFIYSLGRKFTSERIFKKRYKMSYKWHIQSEHINTIEEVFEELRKYFVIQFSEYYPFKVKILSINLVIGLTLVPKKNS